MTLDHPDANARLKQREHEQIAAAIARQPSVMQYIRAQQLCKEAKLPSRSNPTDAGYDLYATESVTIQPGHRGLVSTGIALEIPDGYAGLIWPRSGMAVKNGIDVLAGVIDSGYRGEIKVCLYNSTLCSNRPGKELSLDINVGDRIAQILFQPIGNFTVCWSNVNLDSTDRGSSGFGSTGA